MLAISTETPAWLHLRAEVRGMWPKQAADHLLGLKNITEPPVDVEALARSLGVSIHRVSNPGWTGAVKTTEETATVWIRQEDGRQRQRFTIAHELGHLLLHPLGEMFRDTMRTFSSQGDGDAKERQANSFAAALLVPLWMLERYIPMHRQDAEGLAKRFDVSLETMIYRLERLG